MTSEETSETHPGRPISLINNNVSWGLSVTCNFTLYLIVALLDIVVCAYSMVHNECHEYDGFLKSQNLCCQTTPLADNLVIWIFIRIQEFSCVYDRVRERGGNGSKMAALKEEQCYGLSCGRVSNGSNISVFHVKLTDSALKAFEEYQNSKVCLQLVYNCVLLAEKLSLPAYLWYAVQASLRDPAWSSVTFTPAASHAI